MKTIFRTMSVIAAMLVFCLNMRAENDIDKSLFGEKTELKHKDKGKLTLDIDNLNFFHNNEYWGGRTSGYTLPGFYLKSTIGYQPLKNVKVSTEAMSRVQAPPNLGLLSEGHPHPAWQCLDLGITLKRRLAAQLAAGPTRRKPHVLSL